MRKRRKRRGQPRTRLHIQQVLDWCDEFYELRGRWPKKTDGRVPGLSDIKWLGVDNALRLGLRGLPGGSSLAQLLAQYRGVRNIHSLPRYSIKQILVWADLHHQRTGLWPTPNSGSVVGAPGETWMAIHRALDSGRRGLRGGTSLAQVLFRYRRVRLKYRRQPPLKLDQILLWADAHRRRTGQWPREESGKIPEAPGETWRTVSNALREGRRGFRKGMSLALLLAEHRGMRYSLDLPALRVAHILAWADAFHARHGRWPNQYSGPIEEAPGETWSAVHVALANGRRRLKGGSSLAQLLAEHRGMRNPVKPPQLSVAMILQWADAHHQRTGAWPGQNSGKVLDAPDETWLAVDHAARRGTRGLKGTTSLATVLLKHRGVKPKHRRQPPLDVATILKWADAHFRRTGRWPNQNSGPIPPAPGETWCKIHTALREGKRGLKAGQTIGKLLAEHRPVRNLHTRKRLSTKVVLAWANAYRARNGRWPNRSAGSIDGQPGDNWRSVDSALRFGLRGLEGGSSLAQLLEHDAPNDAVPRVADKRSGALK